MSGALYQLHCAHSLPPGTCVFVNGPYDEFGVIVKAQEAVRDNLQLYLIRGTGRIPHDWPVHDTVSFQDYEGCAHSIKETNSYSQKYCSSCKRAF